MEKLKSVNPANNYEVLGEMDMSSKEVIRNKVDAARRAQPKWKNIGVKERVFVLQRVYDAFFERSKELSTVISKEMGFPIIQQVTYDMGDGFNSFKWYLENAEKLLQPIVLHEDENEIHTQYFEPTGVAAVIQPWNFPFCQWSWTVVPNLLAGNTVVFKHSEECPMSGKLIEEIILSAGLPDGVFSEIYGDALVGEMLTDEDIDLISFTGSTKVGKLIYEKAGRRFIKSVIEMGGSAAGIVFDDADIENTVASVYGARFTNNGQACDGLKRLLVHEKVFVKIVELLKLNLEIKKIGDPLNPETEFGPLVAKRQQELIIAQVKDAKSKGASVVIGGEVPKELKGAFYKPTILTNVNTTMRVWNEEVFGPVLPVIAFRTEEEAIRLANGTLYGLGGYVYTKDLERADRVAQALETGDVSINGTNYVCPWNPFGGYKNSGMGRGLGAVGLHELCQIKVVARNKN